MKKKGQAAMEYLMTYGWAILIIVVVIGALFAMGVFKTESAIACSPCFSNFAFVDYADGSLMLRSGANEINDISISATPDSGGDISADVSEADPGELITITGVDTDTDVDLTITYNHTSSGLTHTDTATIHS